jgi:hypothetical protein
VSLNTRLGRIERKLSLERPAERCPLCGGKVAFDQIRVWLPEKDVLPDADGAEDQHPQHRPCPCSGISIYRPPGAWFRR